MRQINAFTLEEGVSHRLSMLTTEAINELVGPPPAPVEYCPIVVDSQGLTAENYAALYDLMGLAPARTAKSKPDWSDMFVNKPRTPDWAHYLTAMRLYATTGELHDKVYAAMLDMRRTNRKALTAVRRIADKAMKKRTINRSRIVEALLILGLQTLDERMASRRGNDTQRSRTENAGRPAKKPAYQERRQETSVQAGA